MALCNSDAYGLFISNGDFGLIREVLSGSEKRTVTLKRKSPDTGALEEIPVSLLFKDVVVGFKDIEGVSHFLKTKIVEDLLYSKEIALSSDQNKAIYLDFCIRNKHLKRQSTEFKHTLRADPYFNALRLKFGYAITCHKAQGSEWNNVFVKCKSKSHSNQLTADYFRWLYTAITRTAKNLYLLDPPDIRPWSGIKVVSSLALEILGPAKASEASPPASELHSQHTPVSSLLDSGTFGIPKGATVLLSLLAEVRRLTDGKGIDIDDVLHNQWQESYHFKRGAESARVDISYTNRNKISTVASHGFGGLGSELSDLLSQLKGRPLLAAGSPAVVEVSFPKQFLNDFHEKVLQLCATNGITVQHVVEQQWSLRYSFAKDGAVAVYDIFYNGRDQIKKCQPVPTACSPGPLAGAVGQMLTVGMQG
jgi:hypothetical protein